MNAATETMAKIREHGKEVADDSMREVGALSPGDFTAQGDVMIWKLDKIPPSCIASQPVRQLAPGTTKGSRHCIRESDIPHCEFFVLSNPNALQGPIIKAKHPFVVEHPEHGDQKFPAGVWAITYQRAYAEELRAVAD